MSKLAASIFIPKVFRIVQARAEFLRNTIVILRNIEEQLFNQRERGLIHGCICRLACFLVLILVQQDLCFENLSLGMCQAKLGMRDDPPAHSPTPISPIVNSRLSPQSV